MIALLYLQPSIYVVIILIGQTQRGFHLYILIYEPTIFVSVPVVSKCSTNDSKCMTKSGNAIISDFASGIPELGISPLDPLYITEIDLSTPNLKLKGTDVKITGLKQSVLKYTK